MKSKTATFIGHSTCHGLDTTILEKHIERLILNGASIFLCGGMGQFDRICAKTTYSLKKRYPQIKIFLVIPYLSFKILSPENYDEIIYPEGFEKYYFKAAILKRNKYLIDNSSSAICYVNHKQSGAYKTYTYAKKCGIEIINLCSL